MSQVGLRVMPLWELHPVDWLTPEQELAGRWAALGLMHRLLFRFLNLMYRYLLVRP